jgi:uncharacterized membrane protein
MSAPCKIELMIVIIIALVSDNALAQQGSPTIDFEKLRQSEISTTVLQPSAVDDHCRTGDSKCFEILNKNAESALGHLIWTREFIQTSWRWHLISTILLFALVIIIVLFGLLITYAQFHREYLPKERSPTQIDLTKSSIAPSSNEEALPPTFHRLKTNAEGPELTSQVIGLLVLAFSLIFFYLYVKEIYPIHEQELSILKPLSKSTSNDAPKEAK